MAYNRIVLLGNLTRDPELTFLPSKAPVVDFGIATNRKYKTKDGTDNEEVCFIDCRCFGKLAETINKYFAKGKPILVEGRLTFDTWQTSDGQKRSKHRVIIEGFQFLPRGERQTQQQGGGQNPDYDSDYVPPDDDIPFD